MRSCSQFDLLIMDYSQNLYNRSEPDSHCRSEQALSLKYSHAHIQPNKSCPSLFSIWAIIVCLVQLHLKWQWPRATGRIKDYVQSNTPCTSCQRGCTVFPFSPAAPHFPLTLCSYVRHKNILSFLLSYIKALSDSSALLVSLTLSLWLVLSVCSDLPPANCLCPLLSRQIIFLPCRRGVKVKLTGLSMRKGEGLCSAKDRELYLYWPSVSVPACQMSTCHSRGRSVFVCIYVC